MSLPTNDQLQSQVLATLARLGVTTLPEGGDLEARSPITGGVLATLRAHSSDEVAATIGSAHEAYLQWRTVPAPVRGQLVRELGELLREHKADLGELVSVEAGKIRSEGLGEVQEMIDICDLAVGLSRQLHGLTIASERPGHRMMEQWHPLGVVGIISAFNFPVAVWSWNAALALVCGDAVVWKPSEKTLLTALACQALVAEAARRVGAPAGISSVLLGRAAVGEALVADHRVALLSATGSTRMGRAVAPRVAERFGRLLLELGGNNAAIVAPSADLDLDRARHRVLGGRDGRAALHVVAPGHRAPVHRRRAGDPAGVRVRHAARRIAAGRGHARRPACRRGRVRRLRARARERPEGRRRPRRRR